MTWMSNAIQNHNHEKVLIILFIQWAQQQKEVHAIDKPDTNTADPSTAKATFPCSVHNSTQSILRRCITKKTWSWEKGRNLFCTTKDGCLLSDLDCYCDCVIAILRLALVYSKYPSLKPLVSAVGMAPNKECCAVVMPQSHTVSFPCRTSERD